MATVVRCWFLRVRLINLKTQSITEDILTDINARYGYVVADTPKMLIDTIHKLQRQWCKVTPSNQKHPKELFGVRMVHGSHTEDCEEDCGAPHWVEQCPYEQLSETEKAKHRAGGLACDRAAISDWHGACLERITLVGPGSRLNWELHARTGGVSAFFPEKCE